ncbi:integrin alpha [Roseivirga pacifica]|uniref:integrin alpha n=1 Tax=Roseivirga pacifica TaxID=1267423 RepID=UPI003BAFA13C
MLKLCLTLVIGVFFLSSIHSQTITENLLLKRDNWTADFGSDVASAGDINGDGYVDIIIGERHYNSANGAVYVYHGSATGFATQPSWTYTIDNEDARLGHSVDGAGDINGDGYDDIIVGAYLWQESSQNRGKVFVFLGSANGLPSTPNWTKTGGSNGDTMGFAVAGAGDVNNDGYDDILFSAPNTHGYSYHQGGKAWLYYGSSSGVSSSFVIMNGTNANMYLGRSLGKAGDVNGDGYSDIIVSGQGYDPPNTSNIRGEVRVHYGSANGISATADWHYEGSNAQNAGHLVSGAGDVNGDGYDDIIFTGDYGNKYQKLVLGSSSGLASSVHWSLANTNYPHSSNRIATKIGDINGDGFDDVIAVSSGMKAYIFLGSSSGLGATYDLVLDNSLGESFGEGINAAPLGDTNNDGIDDFVIGIPNFSSYVPSAGAVAIFYGDTLDEMTETSDWYAEGNSEEANFGHEVANAGDVNGDGWDDLLVSAWKYSNGHTNEGASFLYYGTSTGLESTPNWIYEGGQHNAYFGYGISTAGDINNDGYDDVIIGAMGYDDGIPNSGRVYIFHGTVNGLSASPTTIINGIQAQAYMGSDVADAGDVNGDGYDDVVIGAYQHTNGENKEGASFVYLGSSSGIDLNSVLILDSDQSNAWFGKSVSKAGDINNDGYDDITIGAPKFDSNYIDEGKAFLYLGSANGIMDSVAWSSEGGQYNAQYGFDVTWSGDNNNDGYDDIIIGAYGFDGVSGSLEGRIFGYHGSSSGLSSSQDFMAFSTGSINALGKAVSFGGDFNNDGYDDIVVGAESTNSSSGAVLIYLGTPQGLDSIPSWTYEATQIGAKLGASVSFAGDVNNDGIDDVVVGSPVYDHGHINEGGVFVFYGEASPQGSLPSPNNFNLVTGLKAEGLTVYPNPFQNELYLQSDIEIQSLKAIDLIGQEISIGFEQNDKKGTYKATTHNISSKLLILEIHFVNGSQKRIRVLKK